MIWSIIQIVIALIGIYCSSCAYVYYFGLIEYNEEKEKRRRHIIAKHGKIILFFAILANLAGLVLLYLHLPVLMSM